MELQNIIAEKEGDFVSFGKILRTGCLLTNLSNKKTLSSRDIQSAVQIHFTEQKRRNAIKEATKKVTIFTVNDSKFTNEEKKVHGKVKGLMRKFSVDKITAGAVIYAMAIYQKIEEYEMEEFEYENEIDIQDFLKTNCYVLENNRKRKFTEKHFDLSKEILCPEVDMTLVWSIDKSQENVEKFIDDYLSDVKLDKSFINQILIYN